MMRRLSGCAAVRFINVARFAAAAWLLLISWLYFSTYADAPLLDHYIFRQTQTATVARELARGGSWLDYRMPVLGPPWSVPMEFPLYQLVVAGLAKLGVPLDVAGRLVSTLSFGALLGVIWLIAQSRKIPRHSTWLIVLITAFSPLYLYWSLAFMIEVPALLFSITMLYAADRYLRTRKKINLIAASLMAALAGLTKVTTLLPVAVLIVAIYVSSFFIGMRLTSNCPKKIFGSFVEHAAAGLIMFTPVLLIVFAWVHYADEIKRLSPLTEFLTSERLAAWNYGNWSDLAKALTFIFGNFRGDSPPILEQLLGYGWPVILVLSFVGLVIGSAVRMFAGIALAVAFLSGPVLFSNLYKVHYYYWVANSIFLLGAMGLGLGELVSKLKDVRILRLPTWSILTVLSVLIVTSSLLTFFDFFVSKSREPYKAVLVEAQRIKNVIPEHKVVLVFGFDWNPAIQYYSDRKMIHFRAKRAERLLDDLRFVDSQRNDIGGALFCRGARSQAAWILNQPIFAHRTRSNRGIASICDLYAIY